MNSGSVGTLLRYEMGHFIFDFWALALPLLFSLIALFILGVSYRRKNKQMPYIVVGDLFTAWIAAALITFIDHPAGQALVVLSCFLSVTMWRNENPQNRPLFLSLCAIAFGALAGMQLFLITLFLSVLAAIVVAFQPASK